MFIKTNPKTPTSSRMLRTMIRSRMTASPFVEVSSGHRVPFVPRLQEQIDDLANRALAPVATRDPVDTLLNPVVRVGRGYRQPDAAEHGQIDEVVTDIAYRLVGQTEANIRQALKIADAMAPCVLMVDEIEKALSASGNQDFEMVELDGLNHLFQKCETGSISEYITIQETFNPVALKKIGDWIAEHTTVNE